MVCIYDYSGWANVMESHIHHVGTYIHVCEHYIDTRIALGIYPYTNLVWLYIALREYTRTQIIRSIWLHVALWESSSWERPGRLVTAYRLVLVNVWAELCSRRRPPLLTRALSLSQLTWGAIIRSWSTSSVPYPASTSPCVSYQFIHLHYLHIWLRLIGLLPKRKLACGETYLFFRIRRDDRKKINRANGGKEPNFYLPLAKRAPHRRNTNRHRKTEVRQAANRLQGRFQRHISGNFCLLNRQIYGNLDLPKQQVFCQASTWIFP